MNRRHLVTTLGATLGSIATVNAADHHKKHKGHQTNDHFRTCADTCADCATECASCFDHCASLLADGKKEHEVTMRLCSDCADICRLASTITSRQGPLTAELCTACADACDRCAEACAKHKDDQHMMACAKACRECAKECRTMLKHLSK